MAFLTQLAIPDMLSPVPTVVDVRQIITFFRMSQDNMIKLECTVCKLANYFSRKNKKTLKDRLELKKFCKQCKKHTAHKETK